MVCSWSYRLMVAFQSIRSSYQDPGKTMLSLLEQKEANLLEDTAFRQARNRNLDDGRPSLMNPNGQIWLCSACWAVGDRSQSIGAIGPLWSTYQSLADSWSTKWENVRNIWYLRLVWQWLPVCRPEKSTSWLDLMWRMWRPAVSDTMWNQHESAVWELVVSVDSARILLLGSPRYMM